jgi:hypothetical protein
VLEPVVGTATAASELACGGGTDTGTGTATRPVASAAECLLAATDLTGLTAIDVPTTANANGAAYAAGARCVVTADDALRWASPALLHEAVAVVCAHGPALAAPAPPPTPPTTPPLSVAGVLEVNHGYFPSASIRASFAGAFDLKVAVAPSPFVPSLAALTHTDRAVLESRACGTMYVVDDALANKIYFGSSLGISASDAEQFLADPDRC